MEPKPILDLNAFDARSARGLEPGLSAELERRGRLFGPASVLFYDEPLELVRGAGCWLYAADGTAYLDAYNNVPSVGHCHPHVVAAASRQLGELNIHNRYLHRALLAYSERLLATLPPELGHITFTCTGSESNDLALRLAAEATGARGVIVTESAYHGNTALVTPASPTLCRQPLDAPDVALVAAPAGGGERFAADVAAALAHLEGTGAGCAALLVDSIFSSDGVFADPPGFLRAAVDVVHRAGGLYIADEVQSGFGRTGAGWWGFARHGVLPDVVTLGKPMGNGYPMGAVIARPRLLEAYCARFGYFNTFAGSPVAAAVGGAVLDVIEREELIGAAARVGACLRAGLEELALRHPAIGAVRGAGLYIGVDLTAAAGAPAPRLAQRVINGLRRRGVLIGAAGKFGSTLKIRPPLCFSTQHADQLLTTLDTVLGEFGAGAAGAP